MLKLHLNGASREISLPGGAVLRLRAQLPVDVQVARTKAAEAALGQPEEDYNVYFRTVLARTLLQRLLETWDGIGDMEGNPIEPSEEAIDHLLMIPRVFDTVENELVMPIVRRIDEKNGSPPSANGTSPATSQGAGEKAAAAPTARTARATARNART